MAHTRESIRALLNESDRALDRGVVAIYRRQTESEKHAKGTHEDNGVGFNHADARLLSTMAQELLAGKYILPTRREEARKKMLKYAGQLLDIATAKEFGLG